MIQPAIVDEVRDDLIFVRYPSPQGEKSKTSRSFWNVKEQNFPVENPKDLALKKGDVVEIFIEPAGAIKAAFMVFIVPLIGFFIFYKVAELFSSSAGLLFSAGILGLGSTMTLNIWIYKAKSRGERPKIQRCIPQEEHQNFMKCNSTCEKCGSCGYQ